MSKQLQSEIQVLDRILHLLEERSVSFASESDKAFESFINSLYDTVSHQAKSIATTTMRSLN